MPAKPCVSTQAVPTATLRLGEAEPQSPGRQVLRLLEQYRLGPGE